MHNFVKLNISDDIQFIAAVTESISTVGVVIGVIGVLVGIVVGVSGLIAAFIIVRKRK